ncbi:unnamed protein product [Caenorhabditis sp. 36 PRJEB53466]|nr:unnamed protein product [Caenorhabditis sp. 36 PRJEB53466]
MYEEEQLIAMKAETFQALTPTKRFEDTAEKITDVSYSEDGKGLIVSANDVILVYDLNDGTKTKSIECMKYGVDVLEYSDFDACIHSSNKHNHDVRLLSLTKKSYVRYFPGHTKRVNCITMHPRDGSTFMTSSHDQTLRLWDKRTFENIGFMNILNVPLVAYDPEGLLFAVATRSESIKLFDVRSFDLGPFKTFRVMKNDDDEWTNIEFSPCGKFILVSTMGGGVKWIDSFLGKVVHNFSSHKNPNNVPLRATVSTDSQFVMVGSADRFVYVYSTDSGEITCKLRTPFPTPAHIVAFNQKQFLLTSISRELILWAPREDYV